MTVEAPSDSEAVVKGKVFDIDMLCYSLTWKRGQAQEARIAF